MIKPERTGTGVLHTKCKHERDHEYSFSWELDAHRDGVTNAVKDMWCFSIVEDGDLFQFEIVDEGTYMRVQNIDKNECERYGAKGIPEAFIRLTHRMFQLSIGSSKELFVESKTHPGVLVSAEKHSEDAGKLWKRLVGWGEAYKDETEGRYFYPVKKQNDAPVSDTLESLWAYCTANNRLVPMPNHWNELFGMLKNKKQKSNGDWEPPLPLMLAAWHDLLPIVKQLRFKEHLDWALSEGQIAEVGQFLRALPETQWCHFGES
jgi:hypothetical protein